MTILALSLFKDLANRISIRRNEEIVSYFFNTLLLYDDLSRDTRGLREGDQGFKSCSYLHQLAMPEEPHLDKAVAHNKRFPICQEYVYH